MSLVTRKRRESAESAFRMARAELLHMIFRQKNGKFTVNFQANSVVS